RSPPPHPGRDGDAGGHAPLLMGFAPPFVRQAPRPFGRGASSACRETRHAAQEATAAHGNCLTRLFPLVYPLRQNFTANRALVTAFLAHNLPQNFPGGVAVVGACPPTATVLDFFDALKRSGGGPGHGLQVSGSR